MIDRHEGWVHVTAPDERERGEMEALGVPAELLRHALDVNELARIMAIEPILMVILRVPLDRPDGRRSIPLGVIVQDERMVTVSAVPVPVLDELTSVEGIAGMSPFRRFLQLLLVTASAFVSRVNQIDEGVDQLERALQTSQGNKEVLALLEQQKALVRLERALASNQLMLERLSHDERSPLTDEDRELLGDAIVEVSQALQTTRISAEILSSMMDAFASIISNNLNVVMKVLAALTVLFAIPSVVLGIWGMNVPLPWADRDWAFLAISAAAFGLSMGLGLLFYLRRWLSPR